MRKLLMFTALAEGATGAALLLDPSIIVKLLFGEVVSGAGAAMARLAGMCLVALAVACRPGGELRRGVHGMLSWSVGAAVYLAVIGIGGKAGVLLWPMVCVHAVLSALFGGGLIRQQKSNGQ